MYLNILCGKKHLCEVEVYNRNQGSRVGGLLKAEQFTNLQQLRAKTTVFFTGCQVYSAHISRPCVIRLLTWLWDRARCAGAAWHSFLSLGMIWFSSALPPVRWPKEKLSSFSWQAVLHRSSEWRGVSVSFCALSKWEWKNRGERRESTLDEKKSLLCVYSVWTVASSACERQTLLVTSVCCVLDIVKIYFKRIYYFILNCMLFVIKWKCIIVKMYSTCTHFIKP